MAWRFVRQTFGSGTAGRVDRPQLDLSILSTAVDEGRKGAIASLK